MAKTKQSVAKPKGKATKAKEKTDTKARKERAVVYPQAKVIQVGWQNENPNVCLILLSKKERMKLNLKQKSAVKISKGDNKEIAIVGMQFKEHVGKNEACTLNTKLAYALKADVGDKVTINPEVTESEYSEFQTQSMPSFADFLSQIR